MALRRRSLVPSTARSLFGGTKRECGVETVGSEIYHLMPDCEQAFDSLNARFSRHECTALRFGIGFRTLRERYFPAMESTQRYGRRGVSNPPSCTSPQRPLIRRGGWLLGAIRYAICRGGPSGCIAGSSLLTVDFLRDTMAKEGSFDRCFPEDITKSFPHFPLFFPQNKGFFRKETIDVVVLPCRRG